MPLIDYVINTFLCTLFLELRFHPLYQPCKLCLIILFIHKRFCHRNFMLTVKLRGFSIVKVMSPAGADCGHNKSNMSVPRI